LKTVYFIRLSYLQHSMSDRPLQAPALKTTIHWSHQDSPKVGLILTIKRGLSLIASQPIAAGEKLMAFDGSFHDWGSTTRNLPNDPPHFLRDHCIQVGEGRSRDSTGLARYANHSCEPNCGITDLIWITAMQDIVPGTELSWDYAMTEDNDWQMECSCGHKSCRRVIAGYRHLPPEKRAAYDGYLSSWLTARLRPYLGPAIQQPSHVAKAG
jgi:uncharacterized protein